MWQELIGWERFRIAVLEPAVVFGNMVSNYFVLWSKGIPSSYIWRMANEGIASMRAYQKLVTESQKLDHRMRTAPAVKRSRRLWTKVVGLSQVRMPERQAS
jgi:hypothetical protein